MGLDMSVGNAYVRLNWSGVRGFAAWSQEFLGHDYFGLLTPEWRGDNGQELTIDGQGAKKFLLLYHGRRLKDIELARAHLLVTKKNIEDCHDKKLEKFIDEVGPKNQNSNDPKDWEKHNIRYYKCILAITYNQLKRTKAPLYFCMG